MSDMHRIEMIYARPPRRWGQMLWTWLLFSLALSVAYSAGRDIVTIEPPPVVHWAHFPSIPEMVVEESSRAGISAHLPLAVGWQESRLTNALSRTQDAGALQVNIPTAIRMGLDPVALLEPRNAIAVGVAWLLMWQDRCGSESAAVWAYGHGRCRVPVR